MFEVERGHLCVSDLCDRLILVRVICAYREATTGLGATDEPQNGVPGS